MTTSLATIGSDVPPRGSSRPRKYPRSCTRNRVHVPRDLFSATREPSLQQLLQKVIVFSSPLSYNITDAMSTYWNTFPALLSHMNWNSCHPAETAHRTGNEALLLLRECGHLSPMPSLFLRTSTTSHRTSAHVRGSLGQTGPEPP